MTDNQDRTFYLINIKRYLSELSAVVGRTVEEAELLNAKTTKEILARGNEKVSQFISLRFEDLKSEKFKLLLHNIDQTNQGGVYIWIKDTPELGTVLIPSIKEFNCNIKFDDLPGEVIILTSEKSDDRILLEFYLDDEGNKFMEIEISGDIWKNVDLSKFKFSV